MDRRYYTTKEVADILRVSDDFVIDAIRRDEIPGLWLSSRIVRIPVAGLERYLAKERPVRRNITIKPVTNTPDLGFGEELPGQIELPRRTTSIPALSR